MKQTRTTNRNKIIQLITLADGSIKKVFHVKPFHTNNFKELWNKLNTTKKEDRKFIYGSFAI